MNDASHCPAPIASARRRSRPRVGDRVRASEIAFVRRRSRPRVGGGGPRTERRGTDTKVAPFAVGDLVTWWYSLRRRQVEDAPVDGRVVGVTPLRVRIRVRLSSGRRSMPRGYGERIQGSVLHVAYRPYCSGPHHAALQMVYLSSRPHTLVPLKSPEGSFMAWTQARTKLLQPNRRPDSIPDLFPDSMVV